MSLSSSKISYPHLYQITYFREGSTLKINEKGWAPILFDIITDTKGPPYIFFRASPRIAGEMARRCECSSSLLSQIERGIVNPSFSTLKSIGDALEITLAQLVMEASTIEESSSSLMKQKERKILTTEGGVQFQLLSRNVNVPFEFILNHWPPGTSTGKQPYTHEGEECGLLLEGELEVEVNGKIHRMKQGDTVTLRSSAPHRISNPGDKKALAVWVNSAPWVFSIK